MCVDENDLWSVVDQKMTKMRQGSLQVELESLVKWVEGGNVCFEKRTCESCINNLKNTCKISTIIVIAASTIAWLPFCTSVGFFFIFLLLL